MQSFDAQLKTAIAAARKQAGTKKEPLNFEREKHPGFRNISKSRDTVAPRTCQKAFTISKQTLLAGVLSFFRRQPPTLCPPPSLPSLRFFWETYTLCRSEKFGAAGCRRIRLQSSGVLHL
jgi:hypothetical protein